MNRLFVRGRLHRVAVGVLALLLVVPAAFTAPVLAADPVPCATPAPVSGTGRVAVETGLTTLAKAIAACETAGNWQASFGAGDRKVYRGHVCGGARRIAPISCP